MFDFHIKLATLRDEFRKNKRQSKIVNAFKLIASLTCLSLPFILPNAEQFIKRKACVRIVGNSKIVLPIQCLFKITKIIFMEAKTLYCGIDVSCSTLDICYQQDGHDFIHLQVSNDLIGYRRILKSTGSGCHFVMESTGVYHISLIFFLYSKGCTYSVVNGLQIKRYIQMHLERNKTDKKDARRICEYGIERKPEASSMPDRLYFKCKSLNTAIRCITVEITQFTNQLHSLSKLPVSNVAIVRCYKKLVRELKLQLKGLEKELEMKLSEWQPDLVEQVKSVTGIGKRATAELIVYTQGFKGMQNYRQLISYAGLSPENSVVGVV